MALLNAKSFEATKSELDLWSVPPTQMSVVGGKWIHYKPLATIQDNQPIEFTIPSTPVEYIDLAHTMLCLKAQILKADGTPLAADAEVGPVNNWMHSLFSQVDVYLNQKLVSPPSNTYGYRAYIETLLSYGPAAKKSHLTSALYYKDENMDSLDENTGYQKRKKFAKQSKIVDMRGPLICDIFNVDRYLLNGVEIRVKLSRSKDTFSLLGAGGDQFKVKIVEATLQARKVTLSPTVMLAHSKALDIASTKFPITRVDTKVLTIPAGISAKTLDNVFLGSQPKRMVVGFVTNKAFNGDLALNPYNFQHFDLNYLSIYIDGEQIPSRPLQPDFRGGSFIESYYTLFSGTGIHYQNEGNNIDREEYASGNTLFAFDFTPDLSGYSSSHWNPVRQGSMRIEVNFANPLTEPINCIVYAEFDAVIQIMKDKNVTCDF